MAGQLTPLATTLRRRRSAGPLAGMALWLAADAGVTLSGGAVATWADQSGNNNGTNTNTGATLVTNAINGLPVVRFGGGNRAMRCGNFAVPQMTTFVVGNRTRPNGNYDVMISLSDGLMDANSWAHLAQGGGVLNWCAYDNGQRPANSPIGASYCLSAAVKRTTGYAFRLNGSANGTWSSPSAYGVFHASYVGGDEYASYHEGDLAEILVYPWALSDPDCATVETYLNAKYAIY